MNKTIVGAVLAILATQGLATFGAPNSDRRDWTFTAKPDENAIRVTVTPVENRQVFVDVYTVGAEKPATITLGYPSAGPHRGGLLHDWHKDVTWSAHCANMRAKRPGPPETVYSNAYVTVASKGWFDFAYSMLPYFQPFSGLYRHKRVEADIANWLRDYPLYPNHAFAFDFRYDAVRNRLEGYLDGSYAGHLDTPGRLTKVVVRAAQRAQVTGAGRAFDFGKARLLPAISHRAHPLLREGAKLKIAPKLQPRLAAAMDIWEPSVSINQGQHESTGAVRELCADPQSQRTPWLTGPEFMQWTVPTAFYAYADVLCADIPTDGRAAKIGLAMTRFGTANVGSRSETIVSLDELKAKGSARAVGTLEYLDKDKKRVSAPLYLARLRLNPFQILQYVNDLKVYGKSGTGRLPRQLGGVNDYLDIEFVGAGTGHWNPRSSVQIFGCTLHPMDFSVVMDQSVRGNLFERGSEKPETGIRVTAERDNASGTVRYAIYDVVCKEIAHGEKTFKLAKKGDSERLSFDLDQPKVGWYGVDFTFLDAKGVELGVHEASYTILAADDREWGCDSPYAAWPLGGGYHNSDPDRRQQAIVMRKAGYRGSWQPPVERENEFGFPLTCSNVGQGGLAGYCNPCSKRSAEELKLHLDKAVAKYRDTLEKFPSCRYIQLLHEQGGRDVDACLYDPKKACKRGEYKGIDGRWDVYYCTEFAKRMRQEFPNLKIFIGNGSVSSEKIADLVRNGFDLSLVDQLGIESKGFSTLPELSCHREAPGCLWALKETGRYFGYSNLTLNACNEYVFRPERRVDRNGGREKILRMANYAVRDYLLSLAHGCGIISSGHLEDCNDAYYDTNWGCGGQCTFYPFSYPKRMYTAIAVLTRVLDKVTLSRVLETGGNSTYALEFKRDRKAPDYAYAFWTANLPVRLALTFPAGTKVRHVDMWGVERTVGEKVELEAGASPCYLIADKPAVRTTLPGNRLPSVKNLRKLCGPELAQFTEGRRGMLDWGLFNTSYGTPGMPLGTWKHTEVNDPEIGKALEMELVRTEPAPSPLLWEAGQLRFKKPFTVAAGKGAPRLGMLVKGNGGGGAVALGYYSPEVRGPGYCFGKTHVFFDGWQLIEMTPPWTHLNKPITKVEVQGVLFGTGRKALNPIEMADVTGNLRFGGIYLLDGGDDEKESDADRRGRDVMKRDVNDKDL